MLLWEESRRVSGEQVSNLLFVPKILKAVFQDTCWTVFSDYITMVAWQSEVYLYYICMLAWEKVQPFSKSSVLMSSFFMSEKIFQDTWWIWSSTISETLNENPKKTPQKNPTWNPKETSNETLKKPLKKTQRNPTRRFKWNPKETLNDTLKIP